MAALLLQKRLPNVVVQCATLFLLERSIPDPVEKCTCCGWAQSWSGNITVTMTLKFFFTNPFYVQGTSMHNQQHTKRWADAVSTFFYRSYKNNNEGDDIWPSIVRASNCQCQSHNCPGFDPSIFRHSDIWGRQMKQFGIKYRKKTFRLSLVLQPWPKILFLPTFRIMFNFNIRGSNKFSWKTAKSPGNTI